MKVLVLLTGCLLAATTFAAVDPRDLIKFSGDWSTQFPALLSARSHASFSVVDSTLWVLGGEAFGATFDRSYPNYAQGLDAADSTKGSSYYSSTPSDCIPSAGLTRQTQATLDIAGVDTIVLVGGGHNKICLFDPAPNPPQFANPGQTIGLAVPSLYGAASVAVNNIMYIVGGHSGDIVASPGSHVIQTHFSEVDSSLAWTTRTLGNNLGQDRAYHSLVADAGANMWIVFGWDGTNCRSDLFIKVDFGLNSPFSLVTGLIGDAPEPRCGAAAVYHGGNIIVLGGSATLDGPPTTTVQIYEHSKKVWRLNNPAMLGTGSKNLFAAAIYGRLFYTGGMTSALSSSQTGQTVITDEQESNRQCYEKLDWNGAIDTFEDGLIGFATQSAGGLVFKAEINIDSTGACYAGSGQMDCVLLSKSLCSTNEGGTWFGLKNQRFYLLGSSGYFTFSTGTDPYRTDDCKDTDCLIELTYKGKASGQWILTVKNVGTGVLYTSDPKTFPMPLETALHDFQIGSCETSLFLFGGTIKKMQLGSIGACIALKITKVVPGLGSVQVDANTPFEIHTTNPSSVRSANVTGPFMLELKDKTTSATQVMDSLQFHTEYTSPTGKIAFSSYYDDVEQMELAKFIITPDPTTFQIAPHKEYSFSMENKFFKDLLTEYAGFAHDTLWTFSTRNLPVTQHEDCDVVDVVLNAKPSQWNRKIFCNALSRVTFNAPCERLRWDRMVGHGTEVLHLQFHYTRMAPGSCAVINNLIEQSFATGDFNFYLLQQRDGATKLFGTGPPFDFGALHTHATAVITKNQVERWDWEEFQVSLSPNLVSSPTTVSWNVGPNLPMAATLELILPIGFTWDSDSLGVPNLGNIQLTVRHGASFTSAIGPISAQSVESHQAVFKLDGPGALTSDISGVVQLELTGAIMPENCDVVDSWVWTAKLRSTVDGKVTRFTAKNVETDRCEGKTTALIGDPHFESFSGGHYDVNGKANSYYNIITDSSFVWNSRFVSRNSRGGTMYTYIGETAFLVNDTRVEIHPHPFRVFIDGKEVHSESEERIALGSNQGDYLKVKFHPTSPSVFLKACGFNVALKVVEKDHGKVLHHFDHIVSLGRRDHRNRPHGLLGQTAMFTHEVTAKGHQGEGVIEGKIEDYELGTLWSRGFKFNRYVE